MHNFLWYLSCALVNTIPRPTLWTSLKCEGVNPTQPTNLGIHTRRLPALAKHIFRNINILPLCVLWVPFITAGSGVYPAWHPDYWMQNQDKRLLEAVSEINKSWPCASLRGLLHLSTPCYFWLSCLVSPITECPLSLGVTGRSLAFLET